MDTTSFKSSRVRTAVKGVLGTTVALPLLFAALPAAAQEPGVLGDLRNQIEAMEDRLDAMQAEKDQDGGALMIGETSVEFSGYIKLDAFYDLEADQGSSLLPADVIATGGLDGYEDKDADLGMTARQTRLSISTLTPTEWGDIGGFIQMDMYGEGADAGGAPRLRLAYLTWNNWTIGRNWTTFSNFYYGSSLNFAGPAGQVFSRQEQIRYTIDLGNGSNFAIALEDDAANGGVAGPVFGDGPDADDDPDDLIRDGGVDSSESLPALTARYQASMGMVDFQVAGLVRSIDDENLAGNEESTFGWGLNTGGAISLPTGTTLMLTGAYGEGIGNYIYTPTFGPAAYFDSNGDLETNSRYGLIGTITQAWTDQLTSNLIYGYSHGEFGPDDDEAIGTSLSANLLYSPVDPLTFGIEYTRVTAELDTSGPGGKVDGDANRVQFSTIYNF